jgi:hypothetical protein
VNPQEWLHETLCFGVYSHERKFGMRILYTIVLFGCLAHGQTSNRVFSFAHLSTPQDFQLMVNLLRTVGGLQQISVDNQARTLTVNGTSQQIDLANWLVHSFDIDPQGAEPSSPEYTVPDGSDDVVRVFYVPGLTQRNMQEIINTVRTISDITRMYQIPSISTFCARGTASQIALARWLVDAMEHPSAGPHEFIIPEVREVSPRWDAGVVRVFYLAHTKSAQDIQDLVNALRTITEIAKIYQYTERPAIVVRGNSRQIPVAQWIVERLDQTAAGQVSTAAFTASIPHTENFSAVRIFYFPTPITRPALAERVNAVRSSLGITRIYSCPAPGALVLRATPAQALQAETMMANQ